MFTWLKKIFDKNPSTTNTTIKAIVAIDENNGIGKDGELLFSIRRDMQHFTQQTKNDAIIMRSGTFESFGKRLLKDRLNIVISRQENYDGNGAVVSSNLIDALLLAENYTTIWIIGGGGLYTEALPLTEEIEITQIFAVKDADVYFPAFKDTFECIQKSEKKFDEKNNVYFQFQTWKKKTTL